MSAELPSQKNLETREGIINTFDRKSEEVEEKIELVRSKMERALRAFVLGDHPQNVDPFDKKVFMDSVERALDEQVPHMQSIRQEQRNLIDRLGERLTEDNS